VAQLQLKGVTITGVHVAQGEMENMRFDIGCVPRSLQRILFIMRTTTSGGTEEASVGRSFVTGLVDLFTLWKIAMVFVSLLVELS